MRKRIMADGIYKYYWVLNPMMSNTETGTSFGPFDTKEEAVQFIKDERVEPYTDLGIDMFNPSRKDKKYNKCFRRDGVLEWYNPPDSEEINCFGHGLHEVLERVENVIEV